MLPQVHSTVTDTSPQARLPASWYWLGALPVAVGADSLAGGIGLGTAVAATIALTCTIGTLLAARLAPTSRVLAAQLVAAGAVALAGLLGQAFAYEAQLAFGAWLPLVIVNGALLSGWDDGPGARAPAAGALLRAAALAAASVVTTGAIREFGGRFLVGLADCQLAGVPAAAFLLLALLLAATGARRDNAPPTA